jgi:hypothetical protein
MAGEIDQRLAWWIDIDISLLVISDQAQESAEVRKRRQDGECFVTEPTRSGRKGRWHHPTTITSMNIIAAVLLIAVSSLGSLQGAEPFNRNIPQEAHEVMTNIHARGIRVKSIAFTPDGGWTVLYGRNGSFSRNVPEEAHQQLGRIAASGEEIKCIAYAPNGGWSILYGYNRSFNRNIPDKAHEVMLALEEADLALNCIAFAPNGGWSLVFGGGHTMWNEGVSLEISEQWMRLKSLGHKVKAIAFAPNGGWSLLYGRGGSFNRNIPEEAHRQLGLAGSNGSNISCIAFSPQGGWSVLAD